MDITGDRYPGTHYKNILLSYTAGEKDTYLCNNPYVDEGLRYEIKDFIAAILTEGYYFNKVSKEENLMMAQVQEMYINNQNVYKL